MKIKRVMILFIIMVLVATSTAHAGNIEGKVSDITIGDLLRSIFITEETPLGGAGYTNQDGEDIVNGLIDSNTLMVNNSYIVELVGTRKSENRNINIAATRYLYDNIVGRPVRIEVDTSSVKDTKEKVYLYLGDRNINLEMVKLGILEYDEDVNQYHNISIKQEFEEASEKARIGRKGVYGTGYTDLEIVHEVINPYIPYSNDKLIEDIDKLGRMYPALIETKTIGLSVEGREIKQINIGKGDRKIHLNGSLHAREYFTTTALMKMVEDYAYAYYNNNIIGEDTEHREGYDVKEILDQVTLHIIPMVNPDGVNIAINGYEAALNPNEVRSIHKVNPFWAYKDSQGNALQKKFSYDYWKANARGVDLNNQFNAGWDNTNRMTGPSSEGYKGVTPESEPEVQAVIQSIIDGGEDYEIYSALHTKGQIIYWGDEDTPKGELEESKVIVDGLSKVTGYIPMPISKRKTGGFSDWARQKYSKPGITIELTPPGLYSSYDHSEFDMEYERTKYIGIYLASTLVDRK